ncbi:MAG: hypothetical protein ACYC1C_18835 [Chloroflexota bacterium]
MIWNEKATQAQRHRRAAFYVGLSFVLAVGGYLLFGFDRGQTFAYGVVAYTTLNLLNYRAMFGQLTGPTGRHKPRV